MSTRRRTTGLREGVVAIVRSRGRVLFIRRGRDVPFAGYWAPISGKLETGEAQADAVVREVAEEVGLVVRAVRRVWESVSEDGRFQLHWWIAEATSRELNLDPREVAEARWLRPCDFGSLRPSFEADAEFFDDILTGFDQPAK